MMTSINYSARLEKLRGLMRKYGIDVVALVPGPNLRYLTGGDHYIHERPILMFVLLDAPSIAIIPKLEVPHFSRHMQPSQIFSWTDAEGCAAAFKAGLDAVSAAGKVVGVESQRMRYFEGEILRRFAPTATITPADDALTELRLHKDAAEIALIERAIQISEEALTLTLSEVKIGMSEREVGFMLDAHLSKLGSEKVAFQTIVHAGGNTALPHCAPLDYRIQAGDPLLFDFGGTFEGYCADITRVVFMGEPSAEFQKFYGVVQAANEQARLAAKPGITAESLDLLTRQVFIDAGYDHLLRHRTGHGLGLDAHEAPYISQGNAQLLQPGMVFTIEPGIYDMGRIGARIEDDVLITEGGARSLTTFNRDVTVI